MRLASGVLVLALATVVAGCKEEAEFGAGCDEAWHQACEEQGCSAGDPEWQGCLINGWSIPPITYCSPETGFPGDEAALCPLSEEEGVSLHYGPSSYDDADEMARYMLDGRLEDENCFYAEVGNSERFYFNQYSGRMRPQSHHMILYGLSGDGDAPRGLDECGAAQGLSSSFIAGSQTPAIDYPDQRLPHTPEDDVTAQYLEPNAVVALDLHYVNRTTDPILREGWINFRRADPESVQIAQNGIMLIGLGISIPAQSVGTMVRKTALVPSNRRIVALTGHFHANGQRFSVWVQRAGSETQELVYEMYDPVDPLALAYRDGVENGTPNREHKLPGGVSGELNLQQGDRIIWECEMDNPTDERVVFGDRSTDQMCNLFGFYTADQDYGVWNSAAF